MLRRIMIVLVVAGAAMVTACDTSTPATGSQAPPTASTPSARGTPPASSSTSASPTATDTSTTGTTAGVAGCGETRGWNTKDSSAPAMTPDALYLVRAGRHDCYDRVVLDINGPAEVGYLVHYVPVVTMDGSGAQVPVAGGAALEVIVRAPIQGYDSGGHQPGRVLAKPGDHFYAPAQLSGWRSLRAVRFAGSFEGQSTIGVGVREKLPFRVFTQLDANSGIRRLVVDVAHDR